MLKTQRFVADQRFDLPNYESMMKFIAEEFEAYARLVYTPTTKILKNWKIENNGGLQVRVNTGSDSVLLGTSRTGKEDLYWRDASRPTLTLALPDNSVNYVEVKLYSRTCLEDTVAVWDATANSGVGAEFTQTIDTADVEDFMLVSNTIAFTGDADKAPLAIVTTAGGVITNVTDVRDFMFHLDTDYDFGVTRTDKNISNIKEMYDALTTAIKELKGTSDWYTKVLGGGISNLGLLERFNYMLVDGGNISWEKPNPNELIWTSNLRIIAAGRAYNYTIAPTTITLANAEVLYVTLPDLGVAPVGPLTVQKCTSAAYPMSETAARNYILAYRSGTKVYFGNGWQSVELESSEETQLGDGITQAWIIATGLVDENDPSPPYTSALIITPGTSFTQAISELDAAVNNLLGLVTGQVYQKSVIGTWLTGAEVTLPNAGSYKVGYNQLEVYFDGIFKESGAGNDYLEIDNGGGIGTKIQLLYDLPEDTKITFRIQIGGTGSGSGGGGVVVGGGGFVYEDFDIPVGGASVISLASDMSESQLVEVLVDGIEKYEGAGRDWTRDAVTNQITFNYTLYDVFVRVKLY